MRLAAANDDGTGPPVPDWALPALRPLPQPWPTDDEPMLLVLHADDGAAGCYGPVTRSVARVALDELLPAVQGRDLRSGRWLDGVEASGRHRSGAHFRLAWSAVELAGWDLRASAAGARVADLLSSAPRERVPVYASMLGFKADHPEAPRLAGWLAGEGYHGQKWQLPPSAGPRATLKVAQRLREGAGDDARLMVDGQGQWDITDCRQLLPSLAELGVDWIEEPTEGSRHGRPPRLPAALRGLLAAGEHAYELDEQLALLLHPSIGVFQPDVGWQGGLHRALVITELAAALGKRVLPHGASFLPGLLLGAACPLAVPAVEYHLSLEPVRQAVHTEPLLAVGGHVKLPSLPGLGVGYRR